MPLLSNSITIANATRAAKKSMTCTVVKDQSASGLLCILSGGRERIPAGAIAVLHVTPQKSPATIKLSDVLGVTAEGKPLAVAGTELTLPAGQTAAR